MKINKDTDIESISRMIDKYQQDFDNATTPAQKARILVELNTYKQKYKMAKWEYDPELSRMKKLIKKNKIV